MMHKKTAGVLLMLFVLQPSLICTSSGRRVKRNVDTYTTPSCGELSKEADEWIGETDRELGLRIGRETIVNWNYVTNLTDENGEKLEKELAEFSDWLYNQTGKVKEFLTNADQICNKTTLRLIHLCSLFTAVPIPTNLTTRREIIRIGNQMEKIYGTTTVQRNGTTYRLYPELVNIMANSRDEEELLWAWSAWHNTTGRKLKSLYAQFVDYMNDAARENGYSDVGVYWQMADYDEDDIEQMMDSLYEEMRPFYTQLHAYVRRKLRFIYKDIDPKGPIPAHLLGNMWAQEWESLFDIVAPYPNSSSNYNVTKAMLDQKYTPNRMFLMAEEFYESIGLERMTSDFWNNSIIARPEDNRPLECHATAWDFTSQTDFRISMCTDVTSADLQTVHHEMGHIEYFMQYRHLPTLFRTGANAAFHEAIGDTIALSVMTDTHLAAIGLIPSSAIDQLNTTQIYEQEINAQMRMALMKVAFLPFGYVLDKWRYMVFRGDVKSDEYTSSWWHLRQKYGGISPPIPRTSEDFDPGAKYHVPANVPYSRYFFSFIGQFQFQESLCKLAGHKGPLHTCDIYRSKEAGERLKSVLKLGASRPWPEVMELFTGQRRFRASAILRYFEPLIQWLKKENSGETIGWGRKYRDTERIREKP